MPTMAKVYWGLGLATATLVTAGLVGKSVVEQAKATADAYLFGYPLVLMDLTRRYHVQSSGVELNHLRHLRSFPDASFRSVVSPNADTLYSMAHLDLSSEPQVLSIPDMRGHYYMTPILDAWTNVFTSPGTRTTGEQPRDYLIVGPNWNGQTPGNLNVLRSPTNMAWMIGRIESRGPTDYSEINALQDRMTLQPLSTWQGNDVPKVAAAAVSNTPVKPRQAPDQQLATWTAESFFTTFCQLLGNNPARPDDTPALQKMREAGLLNADCRLQQSALQRLGSWMGFRKVVAALNDSEHLLDSLPTHNGWRIPYGIGEYASDYRRRAMVAKFGLGANTNEDAIYPTLRRDGAGQILSGAHRYVLHFDKQQLPPVKGFWSLTLYDQAQFFFANPLDRFAIGDRNALHYNPDGSLDLYIQAQAPTAKEQLTNWLPAPATNFNLMLRLYWPAQAVLDRSWLPPAIKRLD
ncbi:hypothetical protein CQ065_01185 [Pseudomonas sp. MYb187]|uniref:DUF1254 domain-containing protein n=1 Tax=Pseudomonas TaxID=286 RepID=UPI000CFE0718|nr:DUF1254 domain-containing protein [Pseudomonas sp. MYb187]PRA73067.1 hypothetical protein CQ065_01185 [Pseudomonas sp. MYb187]